MYYIHRTCEITNTYKTTAYFSWQRTKWSTSTFKIVYDSCLTCLSYTKLTDFSVGINQSKYLQMRFQWTSEFWKIWTKSAAPLIITIHDSIHVIEENWINYCSFISLRFRVFDLKIYAVAASILTENSDKNAAGVHCTASIPRYILFLAVSISKWWKKTSLESTHSLNVRDILENKRERKIATHFTVHILLVLLFLFHFISFIFSTKPEMKSQPNFRFNFSVFVFQWWPAGLCKWFAVQFYSSIKVKDMKPPRFDHFIGKSCTQNNERDEIMHVFWPILNVTEFSFDMANKFDYIRCHCC